MKINYETIISFLTSNDKILKYGELENSINFSKEFSSLFGNKFNRVGVITFITDFLNREKKKQNVSLLASIIYCLFNIFEENELKSSIKIFKHKIINDLSNNDISTIINNKNLSYDMLKIICHYFDINIFILNNDDKRIDICYFEFYDDNRINIILYKKDNIFEPIMDITNNLIYENNSEIIQILLKNKLYNISNNNYQIDTINISELIDKYLENYSNIINDSSCELSNELSSDVSSDVSSESDIVNPWKEYKDITLMKKTKAFLINCIQELKNENKNYNKMTKKELIEILKDI